MLPHIKSRGLSLFKDNVSLESNAAPGACGCEGSECGCHTPEWFLEPPSHVCTSNCKKERRTVAEWSGPIIIPCKDQDRGLNSRNKARAIAPSLPGWVWKNQLYNYNHTLKDIDQGIAGGDGVLHPAGSGDIGKGPSTLCGDTGIAGQEVIFQPKKGYIPVPALGGNQMLKFTGRIRFAKTPFFYRLFFEVKKISGASTLHELYLDMIPWYYRKRCESAVGPVCTLNWNNSGKNTGDQIQADIYISTKNLNEVWLRGRIRIDFEKYQGQWATMYVGATFDYGNPSNPPVNIWKEFYQNYTPHSVC